MENKRIDHIWTILCQNVTVFLPKALYFFFQVQEKLETCRNWNLTNYRRPSFGDTPSDVTTSALDFKQLYIFYKFHVIKRLYLPERIPYLAQIFNCSIQK